MTWMYVAVGFAVAYLLAGLLLAYFVQQVPRNPVADPPDWGRVVDTRIPAVDGGSLEVWRIEPEAASRGIVVFAHGWGRNRDRMVPRARHFGRWGYTTILHSARDHGGSSPRRCMNAVRFAEDIEAVLEWVAEPVILYGHSAGAAGAIIAAHRNPQRVRLLFLEAAYADTQEGLLSLYRWVNPVFGYVFGPMILWWMNRFYRNGLARVSPAALAPEISMPTMLIHGARDRRFPLAFARRLQASFAPGRAVLFVAEGAGHSGSSQSPGYLAAVRGFLRRWEDTAQTAMDDSFPEAAGGCRQSP